jgi:osmotically-inducible protein OsmY
MKILFLQRSLFLVIVLNPAFSASEDIAFSARKAHPVSDDVIVDQVRIKLAADAEVKGGALKVDCNEGVETLSGDIETQKQKDRAERLAKDLKA